MNASERCCDICATNQHGTAAGCDDSKEVISTTQDPMRPQQSEAVACCPRIAAVTLVWGEELGPVVVVTPGSKCYRSGSDHRVGSGKLTLQNDVAMPYCLCDVGQGMVRLEMLPLNPFHTWTGCRLFHRDGVSCSW